MRSGEDTVPNFSTYSTPHRGVRMDYLAVMVYLKGSVILNDIHRSFIRRIHYLFLLTDCTCISNCGFVSGVAATIYLLCKKLNCRVTRSK